MIVAERRARLPKVLALAGPTASGKTGWSLELARAVNGVIICADSRTVYRELNIGAGKVTTEYKATWRDSSFGPIATVKGIDHYGLNLVGLDERFTVGRFQQFVYDLLPVLWKRGRQPLLVGGTGLYISAVVEGYVFGGRHGRSRRDPRFTTQTFIIDRPRQELYHRIDERVDERLKSGMIDEVRQLIGQGWTDHLLNLGLEYRILTDYLQGEASPERLAESAARLKGKIHAYARRQLTWWRHRPDVDWISSYTDFKDSAVAWVRER